MQIYDILRVLLTKVRKPPAHMTDAHLNEKSFARGLAPPIVRTANQTRTHCVLKQWFSALTLCSPTHGFSTNAYSVMCTGGFLRYWQ